MAELTAEAGASPALRPPPGNPRFGLIDPLRGLAVAAVVVIHVAIVTGGLDGSLSGDTMQALGTQALPVLFALSGFLMYRPFVRAAALGRPLPDVRRFARRRVLRIVPAYWTALTVLAIFPGLEGVLTADWWRYYLLLQVYSPDTLGRGIPQAWSLCVEMTFYALLPLWALAVRRLFGTLRAQVRGDLALLALVAVVGGVVQLLASQQAIPYVAGQTLLGQATWLALGMALAVLSVGREHGAVAPGRAATALVRRPEACAAIAAASFAGLVVLVPEGGLFANIAVQSTVVSTAGEMVARVLLGAVLTLAVLVPCVFGGGRGDPLRRALRWGPLAWFGMVSYGVYLWHVAVSELVGLGGRPFYRDPELGLDLAARLPDLQNPIVFVVVIAVSTAIAALSYYRVELPFLERKEA